MNKGKNVLFISYDGMTDPLGQSQVIPYLKGLSKAGFTIYLLSCEKKQAFNLYKKDVEEMLEGSNINWTSINYTKKPPILSTLLDVLKLKRVAKKLHKEYRIDMVHTRPGIPALIGLWMKKKLGVKFLNDIREFYADSRVEGEMWNTVIPVYKTIYNYFKTKENEAVALSDGIVCLTYAAEEIIKAWPVFKKHTALEVIPCSADLQLFNPETISETQRESWRRDLKISKDDFVISYLGSIGGWYLTDELMRFFKILSNKMPAAKILFISPHRHEDIKFVATKYGLNPDMIITQKANRQQVPELLSLSQYSVFFIKPCYSKQSSSPTKHGEIMAMGIPIITNGGVGDVETIVNRYQSGIVVEDFTETAFEAAALQVAEGRIFDKEGIRQGAFEFYALDSAIEKYISIYNKILMQ